MLSWAQQNSSRVVCVTNVHMVMESHWNPALRRILETSDINTPDGMPIVWVMKALGVRDQERVAGMDIFLAVCERCERENVSLYLLGSTPDVLEKMEGKLKQEFPGLELAGTESPPFRPLTDTEDAELIERINRSGAGLTFVSLGCPKQEYWMMKHKGDVQSVMVGVGAVFPVYAGVQKWAPKWVRYGGLEWLYRLKQEPKRLWKRYFQTIPPFMWLALQQIMQRSVQQRRSHSSSRG